MGYEEKRWSIAFAEDAMEDECDVDGALICLDASVDVLWMLEEMEGWWRR